MMPLTTIMSYLHLFVLLFLGVFILAQDSNYTAPLPKEAHFAETFNNPEAKPFAQRWTVFSNPPFTGSWNVESGSLESGIEGDLGLLLKSPAQKHAIVAPFDKVFDVTDKDFVVQYEVRFNQALVCGGAYIKLLAALNWDMKDFNDKSSYSIMFGPDRCGDTNKVHFIFRHKSPITGEFEEKHFKTAPPVPSGQLTHLYTLVVRKDNSFEIFIDMVSSGKGNLLTDMTPSVNPPAEIDDPTDSKPSTWVDNEMMADPEAVKPDDWDESAPKMIENEKAVKPDNWDDTAPEHIPDPSVTKPSDWDDESDGTYEAPMIPNPKCDVGCGPWKRPMIANPAYKGKWTAPMIKNPEYKGVWKAKQIPNPNFFEDLQPHNMVSMAAVGIEVWTMQNDIEFDNFYIGYSFEDSQSFAKSTFSVKNELEKAVEATKAKAEASTNESYSGLLGLIRNFFLENTLIAAISSSIFLVSLIAVCCGVCSRGSRSKRISVPKKVENQDEDVQAADEISESGSDNSVPSEDKVSSEVENVSNGVGEEKPVAEPVEAVLPTAESGLNDEAAPKKRVVRGKTPKE